ncbi:MAG TPA: hypothetical protein VGV87_07640 [Blastocatellia bacterium]|nr:hypothetical protein [Blastocatellia bacterium]
MKRTVCVVTILFWIAASARTAAAQSGDPVQAKASNAEAVHSTASRPKEAVSEVELLKHRIEELEDQNRTMMQLLIDLKSKVEESANVAKTSNTRMNSMDATNLDRSPKSAVAKADTLASSSQLSAGSAKPVEQRRPAPAGSRSSSEADSSVQQDQLRWTNLISEGNTLKFYGFLRLDLDFDSQRPNNGQAPLFITSPDPVLGQGDAGSFSMHPRLSRFGVDYTGKPISGLYDGKVAGKLELDFENGGSESRQIIRIRQAYLRVNWGQFSVLGGQAWDVVSPLLPTVNNDTAMWNAGNIGDRRPQFRVAYEPKSGKGQWSLVGAAGLTGAIDAVDLDANGFRDGEESKRPDAQARIGYSHPLWVKDQSVSFGVSGFYGWLNTTRPVTGANRRSFRSQVVNVDYTLPLASRVSLRGEGWWGRNMSDTRGGAGQGIKFLTGTEIRGRGGWSELSVKASRYYSFHPGFTTDDPFDPDIPATGRTRNEAFYLGNRISPGGSFLIGVDYLRWKTSYKGLTRGLDNRVNVFLQYSY